MRGYFFRHHGVVLLILIALLLSACVPGQAAPGGPTANLTPEAQTDGPHPGLNISVDPRIELLAAVQVLSGYDRRTNLISNYDFAYKNEMEAAFHPFRKHRAVKMFDRMSRSDFSFDAPPAVMLYLTPPPELAVHTPFTPYLIQRAGGEQQLGEFITALREFAVDTDFMSFYQAHQPFYDQLTGSIEQMLAGTDDLAALEAYYGMQQHSYNIILAPLFHAGGFGPSVARPDGKSDIYSIGGPQGMDEQGVISFGTQDGFRYLIWHEFAHSFVNPLTVRHLEDVNNYAHLLGPIQDEMRKQAYNNWETVVNEHIVRAITTRLSYQITGEAAGAEARSFETGRGFVYLDSLLEQLEQYESQRDRYPTFADFYPELIRAFE